MYSIILTSDIKLFFAHTNMINHLYHMVQNKLVVYNISSSFQHANTHIKYIINRNVYRFTLFYLNTRRRLILNIKLRLLNFWQQHAKSKIELNEVTNLNKSLLILNEFKFKRNIIIICEILCFQYYSHINSSI